jgi:hypothetical protein
LVSQLRSSFISALALASIALTAACGTQVEESPTPTAQEDRRLEEDSSTDAEKKPPKCDYNDPTLRFVSRDPAECPAILFFCQEGETAFFNECGCGCQTNSCNDPNRTYVSTDPNTCAVIRFTCEPGQTAFSDSCGCGCENATTP